MFNNMHMRLLLFQRVKYENQYLIFCNHFINTLKTRKTYYFHNHLSVYLLENIFIIFYEIYIYRK